MTLHERSGDWFSRGVVLRVLRMCLGAGLAAALAAAPQGDAHAAGVVPDLTRLSLEELMELEVSTVVSASRYIQSTADAPASVTIVTRGEIQRYGYRNLAELLDSVAGFSFTYDRSYYLAGVRGFGLPSDWNSRVLLLLDGHRLNEPVYGSALYGWGQGVDLGNVAKVEVVRGPASALYGTNAMFAVVNVVTVQPGREAGKELELTLADPGITRITGRLRGEGSRLAYSLDAYLLDREGHPVLEYPEFTDPGLVDDDGDGNPDYPSGFTKGTDEADAYGFRGRLESGAVTVTGFYSWWKKEVPTAQYFTIFDNGRDQNTEERAYLEAVYQSPGRPDFNWLAKISLDYYRFRGDYVYDYDYDYSDPAFIDPPYTTNKDDQWARWTNLEWQGGYSGLAGNRLVFGAEYSLINTGIRNTDDDPYYVYTDLEKDTWALSGYVQDEISLSGAARLVLGANHTVYDDSVYQGDVDRTNPRVGAVVSLSERTRLKVLYGEAFRVPNLYEMLYDDIDYLIANPDLGPEVMRTAELILEHALSSETSIKGSVYRNLIEDLILIEEISPDLFQYQNAPENVISEGFEVEVRKAAGDGLSGFASVALQRTETENGGEELPNSPGVKADAGVSIPMIEGKSYLSFDVHYTGDRNSADLGGTIKASTVANATLTQKGVGPGLDLSVSVRNMFDERYAHPGSVDHVQMEIPQDRRNYSLTARYSF